MNIQSLLDTTLEIEGLLRVLMQRNDADVENLLEEKIDQLAVLNMQREKTPASQPCDDNAPVCEPAAPSEPHDISGEIHHCNEEPAPAPVHDTPAAAEPEPAAAIADEFPEVVRVEDVISKQFAGDFASAFTINDKFRFIRELFNGSSAQFNATIEKVERMESLDQAYDYFLNDLEWDADKDAASDFLVIVANHFNSAS